MIMKMVSVNSSWRCCAFATLLGLVLLLDGYGQAKSPCDSLVPEYCGLPYPNFYFTELTSETVTGVRLNMSTRVFPENSLGISVDPKKWNTFGITFSCGVHNFVCLWRDLVPLYNTKGWIK